MLENKLGNILAPRLQQPLPFPQAPFTNISIDFMESFPKSEGKGVNLVVVDRFNKYAYFIAITHPYTAIIVVKAFMDNIYRLHELLATIVNDKDVVFLS